MSFEVFMQVGKLEEWNYGENKGKWWKQGKTGEKKTKSQPFSHNMRQVGSWEPQDESQLRSPARITFCCEVILQPFSSVCEISQTSFSLAKWSLVRLDICYRHWEIFSIRFLLSKSQNYPCKPPITRFLGF